jgi:hypothetical protein
VINLKEQRSWNRTQSFATREREREREREQATKKNNGKLFQSQLSTYLSALLFPGYYTQLSHESTNSVKIPWESKIKGKEFAKARKEEKGKEARRVGE